MRFKSSIGQKHFEKTTAKLLVLKHEIQKFLCYQEIISEDQFG